MTSVWCDNNTARHVLLLFDCLFVPVCVSILNIYLSRDKQVLTPQSTHMLVQLCPFTIVHADLDYDPHTCDLGCKVRFTKLVF